MTDFTCDCGAGVGRPGEVRHHKNGCAAFRCDTDEWRTAHFLMKLDVTDNHPQLTTEERMANMLAGRCGCGCPAVRSGWFGWRRCIFSRDLESRVRRGQVHYRSRPRNWIGLRQWNKVKERSGLIDDKQVHALLSFMCGYSFATTLHRAHHG